MTLMLYMIEGGKYMQVDTREGVGVKFCTNFEEYFHELTDAWYRQYGDMPAILSGMVGSTVGWKDVRYIDCPFSLNDLVSQSLSFLSRNRAITIIAGAKCYNRLGNSDVMRGEEIQIFGWLLNQQNYSGSQLLCLPGTHTKWALTDKKDIQEFITIPTGELHDIISQYGIFLDVSDDPTITIDKAFFKETIENICRAPEKNFLNMLFSTRSKRILGQMTDRQARTYLSALLIGFDIRSALNIYGNSNTNIPIIGAKLNAELYADALSCFGFQGEIIAGDRAAADGLLGLCRLLKK